MTLRWVGRGGIAAGFHCDFVFASAELLPRLTDVQVGTFDEWIHSGLSDHCPVSVEFDDRTSEPV